MAFDRVEPGGDARADYRAGVVWAALANLLGRGKGKPAYRWTDEFQEHAAPKDSDAPGLGAARSIVMHAAMFGIGTQAPAKGKKG